jgi:predicted SAM-dependent methyltransferase
MACRALLYRGERYRCPCCGWTLRAFTHGGLSFRIRPRGYCPRCNAKARHRRDWLFLNERTNLFTEPLRLLHVAPWYSLSRLLTKIPSIDFVGIDIEDRPHVSHRADVTDLPFDSDTFDAIICIHVLEHVEADRMAMSEMFRVLRPGGWALISVPIDLSRTTYEDPAIVSPGQRRIHFGEAGHVRLYGVDLGDRLKQAGFSVELDLAADLAPETIEQYGLMDDENVFYCTKPR